MFNYVSLSLANSIMAIGSGRGRAIIQARSDQGRTKVGLGSNQSRAKVGQKVGPGGDQCLPESTTDRKRAGQGRTTTETRSRRGRVWLLGLGYWVMGRGPRILGLGCGISGNESWIAGRRPCILELVS